MKKSLRTFLVAFLVRQQLIADRVLIVDAAHRPGAHAEVVLAAAGDRQLVLAQLEARRLAARCSIEAQSTRSVDALLHGQADPHRTHRVVHQSQGSRQASADHERAEVLVIDGRLQEVVGKISHCSYL